MTRTPYTLNDIGGRLSARALLAFLQRLPADSATVSEISPLGGWSRTDMLLARICEGIEQLAWIEACKGAKKSSWPKKPPRIPRPGVEPEGQRIGKDPIPIADFDSWYYGGD